MPTRGCAQGRVRAERLLWVLLVARCAGARGAAGFGAGCCGAQAPWCVPAVPLSRAPCVLAPCCLLRAPALAVLHRLCPRRCQRHLGAGGLPEQGYWHSTSSCLPPKNPGLDLGSQRPPLSPGYSVKCEYTAHKEGVLKEEMLLASETGDGACLKVVVQARVMGKGCWGAGDVSLGPGRLSCLPRGFTAWWWMCSSRGPHASNPCWVLEL